MCVWGSGGGYVGALVRLKTPAGCTSRSLCLPAGALLNLIPHTYSHLQFSQVLFSLEVFLLAPYARRYVRQVGPSGSVCNRLKPLSLQPRVESAVPFLEGPTLLALATLMGGGSADWGPQTCAPNLFRHTLSIRGALVPRQWLPSLLTPKA